MRTVYLDASAGVKLVMNEAESDALTAWLAHWPERSSSSLFRTEVLRATRRASPKRLRRARVLIDRVALVSIDDELLKSAAALDPLSLRSLDAIHFATALRLAEDLEALVTYDRRMIDGARALGLPVASPA